MTILVSSTPESLSSCLLSMKAPTLDYKRPLAPNPVLLIEAATLTHLAFQARA